MNNWILLFALLFSLSACDCVHDQFIKGTEKHFYNDLNDARLLQAPIIGPLRTFLDFSQVTEGSLRDRLMIKHCMDIATAFFYNTLMVPRLSQLLYPDNAPLKCNVLNVPSAYLTSGQTADVGIIVGNENQVSAVYAAKSTACAFLKSNNRPIWGMIMWNINQFANKYDTVSFQELVAVGIHELMHVLAFSALLYDLYPRGTPLVGNFNDGHRLTFPRMNFEISNHFGCSNANGLGLEDQDGTLIASHWEKHHVGNQVMIASTKKNSYMSSYTIALFEQTGWYFNVSYNYAEKTQWGKNKGCNFLNIDDCDFDQFCTGSGFDCTFDGKQIGRCQIDNFLGSCRTHKYFTNTVCNHELYQLLNVNAGMQAHQRGGYLSSCFRSDLRKQGLSANVLNNRCYISICSSNVIYLLINQEVKVCAAPNYVLPSPSQPGLFGLQGTLTCPQNFDNYCKTKKNCPYNCNSNGICINGKCLCTGNSQLTPTCSLPNYQADNIGNTGGRLLFEIQQNKVIRPKKSLREVQVILNCPEGKIFDPISDNCQSCQALLGCKKCNFHGCLPENSEQK